MSSPEGTPVNSSERLKARWKNPLFRARMTKLAREKALKQHAQPLYRAIMEQVWEKLHQAWHTPGMREALLQESRKGMQAAAHNRLKRRGEG